MRRKINEVKEHDGCFRCKHINVKISEEPCKFCTINHKRLSGDEDLWEDIEEPTQELPNPIRPNHYRNCSIECIDAMILTFGTDAVAEFCLINAFKYIWRYKDKNGLIDLNKAMWYVDKAEELRSEDIARLYSTKELIERLKGEYNAEEN